MKTAPAVVPANNAEAVLYHTLVKSVSVLVCFEELSAQTNSSENHFIMAPKASTPRTPLRHPASERRDSYSPDFFGSDLGVGAA